MSWFDTSIMARRGQAKGKTGRHHEITEAAQGKYTYVYGPYAPPVLTIDPGDTVTGSNPTATNGTATISADGKYLVFMPTPGFVGAASATVTGTDSHGASATNTIPITVSAVVNVKPRAVFVCQQTVNTLTLNCNGRSSFDLDGTVTAWHWTTDDGQTATTPEASFTFETDGPHDVTLVVTDNKGADSDPTTNSYDLTPIPPVNHNPVAQPVTFDLKPGESKVVAVSEAFSDPDGDALTYTQPTDATHVSVVISGNGSLATITANTGYTGPASVTLHAVDPKGGTGSNDVIGVVTAPTQPTPRTTWPWRWPRSGMSTGASVAPETCIYPCSPCWRQRSPPSGHPGRATALCCRCCRRWRCWPHSAWTG